MGGSVSLSNKAKQQILRQRIHAMFPYFIRITFPSMGTFRYVNTDEDMSYQGETYLASTFSINPPEKTESKIGDGQLTFSAIYNSGEWIKKIRECPSDERGTIEIIAAIIYTADNTIDGIEPIYDLEFSLTDASWENEISWVMKFDDGMDIVMPCDVMDEIICPGVV